MAKKIMMVPKIIEKPSKKKSEQGKLTDEEMEELSTSLVEALNSKYCSLKSVFGQDVLKSLSIAVAVFFMHQAELTSAKSKMEKKMLYDAIIEDFVEKLNNCKELLKKGVWPD